MPQKCSAPPSMSPPKVSDRLLDVDAPPSTGRTVARCAAKVRAPSKQVSCSGVRRSAPRRPPKRSRWKLTSRGGLGQVRRREPATSSSWVHRHTGRCLPASPRIGVPRHDSEARDRPPDVSSRSTKPQPSTSRASRRSQRSPAEVEQAPSPCARRCPADRCRRAWPGVSTRQSRLEAPMLREVHPSHPTSPRRVRAVSPPLTCLLAESVARDPRQPPIRTSRIGTSSLGDRSPRGEPDCLHGVPIGRPTRTCARRLRRIGESRRSRALRTRPKMSPSSAAHGAFALVHCGMCALSTRCDGQSPPPRLGSRSSVARL